jgi:fatty acid synthase subunit alpha, fungi type
MLEDMRSKCFVQHDATFAGHSLGEFSALSSVADILPSSLLVDVVFYRGLTMQRAVKRDELSLSNYAMCAVNPSRVSQTFDDAALREVVDTISNVQRLPIGDREFQRRGASPF